MYHNEAGVDTLLDDLVELLEQSPKGLRSEALRAQLKADKDAFQVIVKEAIAAAVIKKVGERRATIFLSVGSRFLAVVAGLAPIRLPGWH